MSSEERFIDATNFSLCFAVNTYRTFVHNVAAIGINFLSFYAASLGERNKFLHD